MNEKIIMSNLPTLNEDTQSNTNPYDFFNEVYKLVEPYFVNKYNLKVLQQFPTTTCDGPSITWRILSRVPGGGKSGHLQATGPSYSHPRSNDEFGQFTEIYTQHHKIIYEFALFSTSNAEVNELAWDWEQALLNVIGPLQIKFPGLTMAFDSQYSDGALSWRTQDELMMRTLRFQVVLPIRYKHILKELRTVIINPIIHSKGSTTGRVVRQAGDNNLYFISNAPSGCLAYSISVVQRQKISELDPVMLTAGVDYRIRRRKDRSVYVEWIPEGAPPSVGDAFCIYYTYGPGHTGRAISGANAVGDILVND